MNIDGRLIFEAYKSNVRIYGFSDRGISICRYTLIDKTNRRPKGHGVFEDDYYVEDVSITGAVKTFVDILKEEDQYETNAEQFFVEKLLDLGTLVVITYHKGNHALEESVTLVKATPGKWDDVSVDDEDNDSDVIKIFATKSPDPQLRKDVPYKDITLKGTGYEQSQNKHKPPALTVAMKYYLKGLKDTIDQWISTADDPNRTVNEKQAIKAEELFYLRLQNQQAVSNLDLSKLRGAMQWIAYKTDAASNIKQDALQILQYIESVIYT